MHILKLLLLLVGSFLLHHLHIFVLLLTFLKNPLQNLL